MSMTSVPGSDHADTTDITDITAKTIDQVGDQILRTSQRLVDDAAQGAHAGAELLRRRAHQVQDRALQARDSTVDYIQHQPVQALLIAAAGGALLMWMTSLLASRIPR